MHLPHAAPSARVACRKPAENLVGLTNVGSLHEIRATGEVFFLSLCAAQLEALSEIPKLLCSETHAPHVELSAEPPSQMSYSCDPEKDD